MEIYDSNFKQIETGEGKKGVTPSGGKYYFFFHKGANVNRGRKTRLTN